MPTYRLTIEYEGTRYRGWQEQKNARTVAGELRRAAEELAGSVLDVGGSGRTDAGVHALAQVAHLRLERSLDVLQLAAGLNDRLPADIHVVVAEKATPRFHARHHALSRSYVYQISRRRTALAKRFVWWVKRPLDPRRMAQATGLLRGMHDFVLFCERPREQSSTLVAIEDARLREDGALLLLRFTGSHFLWKMVRRIVGTLVRVGAGELALADFERMLAGRPAPGRAGPAQWTAPPSGLFLERVLYAAEDGIERELRAIVPVT